MIRWLTLLTLLLSMGASATSADVVVYTTQVPQGGGKGLVIDRPATEPYGCGISWQQSEVPIWGSGIDVTQDYPGAPDLVLAFNPATQSDELRIARETGSVILGPRIGHPNSGFQLELEPSKQSGLMVGTDGYALSAYFYNHGAPNDNRTCLDFQNLWAWATDRGENGGSDFSLYDLSTQSPILSFDAGGKMGFYGAPATTKPVVSGSWSDGSAARSMLAALVKLGLATDRTTP